MKKTFLIFTLIVSILLFSCESTEKEEPEELEYLLEDTIDDTERLFEEIERKYGDRFDTVEDFFDSLGDEIEDMGEELLDRFFD